MNPYISSNKTSSVEDVINGESTAELTEHRFYPHVLKMVLWGESLEEIYRQLVVNNIPEEVVDRLYEHARADRIRVIRSDCSHDFLIGVGLIVASVVTFCVCWFGLGFIPRILLFACFAVLGIGSWKFIHGFTGYLMAPIKTGSISDDT